jgi:hypothetical protein
VSLSAPPPVTLPPLLLLLLLPGGGGGGETDTASCCAGGTVGEAVVVLGAVARAGGGGAAAETPAVGTGDRVGVLTLRPTPRGLTPIASPKERVGGVCDRRYALPAPPPDADACRVYPLPLLAPPDDDEPCLRFGAGRGPCGAKPASWSAPRVRVVSRVLRLRSLSAAAFWRAVGVVTRKRRDRARVTAVYSSLRLSSVPEGEVQ